MEKEFEFCLYFSNATFVFKEKTTLQNKSVFAPGENKFSSS